MKNRYKSNGHSVEQSKLLISVGWFSAERGAGFIQTALHVNKGLGSLMGVVLLEFGEECFHRRRIWTSNYKACLARQFNEITSYSF